MRDHRHLEGVTTSNIDYPRPRVDITDRMRRQAPKMITSKDRQARRAKRKQQQTSRKANR